MSYQESVSARKAALLLDVSDTTVRHWIADGMIQAARSKPRQPWQIPLSEIERLRNCEARPIGANHEQRSPNAEEGELFASDAKYEVPSAKVEARSANTNPEVRSSNFAPSDFVALDQENAELRSERAALSQELGVMRVKLGASDDRNEATRREHDMLRETLERSDRDIDHLRGLTSQQADTMQNLTEEIKGLTIALHHEQTQRLQLAADVDDQAEDDEPKKPGFLRRVFRGKPKPKRRRKGKFARVGPS